MARFEVRVLPSVRNDLRRVPRPDVRQVLDRMESLALAPIPDDCRKVTGRELRRVRSNTCRILYELHDDENTVVVIKVGHRSEAHR
jgi:mRNA interferase RelE/StbE